MAGHDLHRRVEVSDHDRTVATAEVTTEGSGGTARVTLRAEPGHITPGRRAGLVDAVLDLPEVQDSARLEAAFPLGDSESLRRLQQRCGDVGTRTAGRSAIIDADLPPSRAGGTSQAQPATDPLWAHNDWKTMPPGGRGLLPWSSRRTELCRRVGCHLSWSTVHRPGRWSTGRPAPSYSSSAPPNSAATLRATGRLPWDRWCGRACKTRHAPSSS